MTSRKRAIVTGGESGLGRACAQRLRQDGIEVVTLDVRPSADHVLSVTDSHAVTRAMEMIGDVDILINSAGIAGPSTSLWETTEDDWERTMRVNVSGTFIVSKAVIPAMIRRGWGRIVNFASMAGKEGNVNQAAYSASKGAIIALTKSAGKELAKTGVLINVVAPTIIDTPIISDMSAENLARSMSKIPMGRSGQPQEVAELVAWLASEKLSYSTGAVYDISGGRATY
jgi:NAD(P)-dependent dehydrogenase (short-subunit alcohol dehydrogenase family)